MEFPTTLSPPDSLPTNQLPPQNEQQQKKKKSPPVNGKKFKDFTLNQKQFYTVITDEEMATVFPKTAQGNDDNNKDEGVKVADGNEESRPEQPASFVAAAKLESHKCLTENNAPTFNTSGSSLVDFFFQVIEQSPKTSTISYLEKSWNYNALHTLKLIASLRDIKNGKGIRRQYQDCLYWLYQHHPETLYKNLEPLLKFGYWKDILQMLMIICFDGFIHPYFHKDDTGSADAKDPNANDEDAALSGISSLSVNRRIPPGMKGGMKRKMNLTRGSIEKKPKIKNFEEKQIYNSLIAKKYGVNLASLGKDDMNELRLKFARDKFNTDLKYKIFHVKVASLFAKQLRDDLVEMKKISRKKKEKHVAAEKNNISLASKWAPSLESHFDRYTLISSTISVELIKLQDDTTTTTDKFEILTKPIPIAVYLSRRAYHKEYCVPLRKFQQIPEQLMSTNQWGRINYARVPSKCMKRSSKLFETHDGTRFARYLEKPETKVAGAGLKPIEILNNAMRAVDYGSHSTETERIVIEKQWQSLVDSIKTKGGGLMKNAIAICDVSGSMDGQPMQAALGLTLITMELCDAPWNSVCITFSEVPEFHHLPVRDSLFDKVRSLKAMKWGMSTNLHQVFELIVSMGRKNNTPQEDMPQILFIFTDMEFNEACPGTGLTNFDAAKDLFAKNNYTLPSIVFWNLRASVGKKSCPASVDDWGVILLSGFSGQQLSLVMEKDDLSKLNPLQFVLDVIAKEKFNDLHIFD